MLRAISSLFASLVGLLIPPRRNERVVAAMTLDDLEQLRAEDGLPYRDERVRAFIWELKYNKNPHALRLAGEFLAEDLLGIAEEELGRPLLVPIPMHATRRRERGHNQTEALCEAALAFVNDSFEYMPNALARIAHTPPQQGLPRRKRLENLIGSMQANADAVRGRVCVVMDDVSTTGATFAEAKRALREAGAKRVHPVALARS
ncbi:MAG TPA: phosphoribosyltransferase family protein [Candidatus Paceibacterota bacterium]|nr:phosphoribosyltransferase family protein [Candidatus Paceibacterota bacterium]